MVWRVNFAHKRLQARMEQMKAFRRQHEQLRTVIVRVLRPNWLHAGSANQMQQSTTVVEPTGGDGGVGRDIKPEIMALEAADANAISEVNLAYENVKEVDGLDITKEGCEAWEAAMKR